MATAFLYNMVIFLTSLILNVFNHFYGILYFNDTYDIMKYAYQYLL